MAALKPGRRGRLHNNPDLAQAARDINALLTELSDEYNPTTEKGQTKIKTAAIEQINQNPTLKTRTIAALKAASTETLAQAIDHPVAQVVIEGAKAFFDPE